MGARISTCARCDKALGVSRILFGGKIYCNEDCALPEDDVKKSPGASRIKDLVAMRIDFSKVDTSRMGKPWLQPTRRQGFLQSFYGAIEGSDGRVRW